MTAGIHISLAGRVAIGPAGEPGSETALGWRGRVTLAYLVLERWRPVARDELAEVVWGAELPPTWRAALRGVVSRIRAALSAAGLDPAAALTSGPGGYQLHLPPSSDVDVEVAERDLDAARAALDVDPGQARIAARRAMGTLRGQFLAGACGTWVERRQTELAELHLQGLEVLSEASARCGDPEGAVRAAEEAVALQPLRESAHVRVMAAHELAGNPGRALRAYEQCRCVLAEELGVAPGPEIEARYLALLGDEPGAAAGLGASSAVGNLPISLTRFVGREHERAEIARLLSGTRLLTLTGSGGAGKSRLGMEVAGNLSGRYPDGAWLVELAGVAKPELLADQMKSALGAPDLQGCSPAEALAAHLQPRRLLVLLDNCEHLLGACASLVDRLLRCCADLHILATSREPMCLGGETVWVIPALASPPPDEHGSLETLLRYDAVALFVDRALSAAPGADLASVPDAVATICRRLEGIPLAIELAAARARAMAIPDIALRLDDRFRLLVGGSASAPARHQTLRAAVDWSFDALTEAERRLFACVAVFAGDFTLEAAEAVSCDEAGADVAWALTRLVEKSLVVLGDRARRRGRYRLLETMRQYGYQALVDTGMEERARSGQLRWAAGVAEAAEAGLEGPDQWQWLQVLDAEHDNLRGALDWASGHPGDENGLRTAASLWRYWEIRGLLSEGRGRLEALLTDSAPTALRAKALNSAGVLAQSQGDLAAARTFYQEALSIRNGLGDLVGVAAALNGLGNIAVGENDLLGARIIFEANLLTSRTLGDDRVIAASLMNLGVVAQLLVVTGRIDPAAGVAEAHAYYLQSLDLYRRLDDQRGISQALENLGALAPYQGDDASAHACLEESLVLRRELRDRSGIAASARFLGHLALRNHEYRTARSLHEECLAIESDLGNRMLMVADLASLAEIAQGEGDYSEARRLAESALKLSGPLAHTDVAARLRAILKQIGVETPTW